MSTSVSTFALAALFSLSFATGCASRRTRSVDDALLTEISPDWMEVVRQARAGRDDAADALAKAERDTAWSEDQSRLARSNYSVERAQLEQAKLAATVAERNGTQDELTRAQAALDYQTARTEAARLKLALAEREVEHARLVEKLAREEDNLALARVEYEKARAVQDLDRVAAQKVPLADFEKDLASRQKAVGLARKRAEAAAERVDAASAEYQAAESEAARRSI